MKIVHVDDFMHPDAGYDINLLSRLQKRQGHDVVVVAGELDKLPPTLTGFFGKDNISARDERFQQETGVKVIRVPLHAYYSGRAVFDRKIYSTIAALKPDVTVVHGMESLIGMEFTLFSRFLPYPIVLDSHSVEMASKNRLKRFFWAFYRAVVAPVIIRRNIPIIRIVNSDFVEKKLGVPLSRTTLLSFGTDIDFFCPNFDQRKLFRAEYNIPENAFLVMYAGKLDAAKGGQFLADTLYKRFKISDREIIFMVIGNIAGTHGESVEGTFKKSENRILRFSTQRYFDLAQYYQSADLALFPKQCSVSFFEAQSCGLPVLFEQNEINAQRKEYGNAVTFTPGSVDDFRTKLRALAEMPPDGYAEMGKNSRRYIENNYNYVLIAQRFTDVLRSAVERWRPASNQI